MKTVVGIIVLFVGTMLGIGYGSHYVMNGIKGGMGSSKNASSTSRSKKVKKSNSMRDQSLFTLNKKKRRR